MSDDELIALITAAASHLSSAQRVLVARFVGALTHDGGAARLADGDRVQRESEREFEERELYGADLERRRREPA